MGNMGKLVCCRAFGLLILLTFPALRCQAQPQAAPAAMPSQLDQPVSVIPHNVAPENRNAMATLVVFNDRDPLSADLAGYYAEKRGIPFDHLIPLSCSVEETISRAEYDQSIAEPMRKALITRGWWRVSPNTDPNSNGPRVEGSSIRFVVLMRGIPLKIAAATNYPGDDSEKPRSELRHNEAAVDSELAALGIGTRQITGPLDNKYFRSFSRLEDTPLAPLLLVCRLDAATGATVRRMIDDSIAAEKAGLWGFAYVDSRHLFSGGFAVGDEWLRTIRDDTTKHGIPCIFDDSAELIPEHYPMRQAALYFGWYNEQIAGALKDEQFRFLPGAVAVHIHSLSGSSLRPPLAGWCAPLLEHGAAATLGNVYEPYLDLTPNLAIFEERLRNGFTFAESAYASVKVLSWMTTFIGDPLYRPFNVRQEVMFTPSDPSKEWAVYNEGAQAWFSKGRPAGERVLQAQAKALKSGIIGEGLGCLQAWAGDRSAAAQSWKQAAKFYKDEEDQVRCGLHLINSLRDAGKENEALALTREQIKAHPKAAATALLQNIQTELVRATGTPVPAGKP